MPKQYIQFCLGRNAYDKFGFPTNEDGVFSLDDPVKIPTRENKLYSLYNFLNNKAGHKYTP